MSLKPLIKKQKIMIDDHKRGGREEKNWDDNRIDIHLDKRTKTRIEGKLQEVIIKIPINSERHIRVENAKGQISDIPRSLKSEILDAFENKDIRERFIADLVSILKDFKSQTANKEKAKAALSIISTHFGLDWDKDKVNMFYRDAYKRYFAEITDEHNDVYLMSIDPKKITIEDTLKKKI